jgi:hypothetical protein
LNLSTYSPNLTKMTLNQKTCIQEQQLLVTIIVGNDVD